MRSQFGTTVQGVMGVTCICLYPLTPRYHYALAGKQNYNNLQNVLTWFSSASTFTILLNFNISLKWGK